tara:strand:- start:757 stop:1308 length:552 start_codon:yes stop_codon:yes gene_type:complete
MNDPINTGNLEILSQEELGRTIVRLTSEILEQVSDTKKLLLVGIPTRGVQLASVLAAHLEEKTGHQIEQGVIDPTFHRDDLVRVGTRLSRSTDITSSLEGRQVVLVDDVIFTGRTVRAAIEALQAWGRAEKIMLLVMVDRGHRELPIQPDFCGRNVPTRRKEAIHIKLMQTDGYEGVYLTKEI